jgi:hypothetical protein
LNSSSAAATEKIRNSCKTSRAFVEGQRLFGVLQRHLSDDGALRGVLRELGCPTVRIIRRSRKATIDLAFAAATELISAKG